MTRGLTLVELMVALVLGLFITLAATAVYLSTSSTTRATQSVSELGETGRLALEAIGREVRRAGFYPAQVASDTQALLPGGFENTKDAGNTIYNQGIFGCQGSSFNPATKACGSTVDGAPDGLVVNYMASTDFDNPAVIGNHRDCNRDQVSNDPANAPAVAAGRPLFVSNRFGLIPSSYTLANGSAVSTMSLACHGNGKETATALMPHLAGIEDLVLTYGVFNTPNVPIVERYYTAAQVAALPVVDGLTAWQRIIAVRVCLVARTPEAVRQGEGGTARTFRNCRGADVPLSNTDRTMLRRFEAVFAVRNNLRAAL